MRYLLFLKFFLIMAITFNVAYSSPVNNFPSQHENALGIEKKLFMGNYQLYAVWNPQTTRYETDVITNPANLTSNLSIYQDSLRLGSRQCKNINFSTSPYQPDIDLINNLLPLGIKYSSAAMVNAQTDKCGISFIYLNDKFLLLMSHNEEPNVYVKLDDGAGDLYHSLNAK